MNRVLLSGRLVRNPEIRYSSGSMAVSNFTLAVDRGYSRQKKQEMSSANKPTADFIRVVVFGVQAENVSKYLSKGSQCLVEGRIQTGSYQANDGRTVYTTDIYAEKVEFLSTNNSNNTNNYQMNDENRNYNSGMNNSIDSHDDSEDYFEDDFEEMSDDSEITPW